MVVAVSDGNSGDRDDGTGQDPIMGGACPSINCPPYPPSPLPRTGPLLHRRLIRMISPRANKRLWTTTTPLAPEVVASRESHMTRGQWVKPPLHLHRRGGESRLETGIQLFVWMGTHNKKKKKKEITPPPYNGKRKK